MTKILASLMLMLLVVCAWTHWLDRYAMDKSDNRLTQALTTYGLARTLNGVISVAQGTEIAIAPAGVGVTISAGQILDPLNDLIERFSWLVLMACASLGAQILLAEIFSTLWVSGLLTAAAVIYSACILANRNDQRFTMQRRAGQLLLILIFVRFLFVAVALFTNWANEAVLQERQIQATEQLTAISDELQELAISGQPTTPENSPQDQEYPSLLDRMGGFISQQVDRLALETDLQVLKSRVEGAIGQFINLIVVFVVQTILIPIIALFMSLALFRILWRNLDPALQRP